MSGYVPDLEKRAEAFQKLRPFLWAPINTEYGQYKADVGSRIRDGKGPFIFALTKPGKSVPPAGPLEIAFTGYRRPAQDFPNPWYEWGNPAFQDFMDAWAWMDERREATDDAR